jgi:hypothetical protein
MSSISPTNSGGASDGSVESNRDGVPHTPCPLHISLALRAHDAQASEFVRTHQGEATDSCCCCRSRASACRDCFTRLVMRLYYKRITQWVHVASIISWAAGTLDAAYITKCMYNFPAARASARKCAQLLAEDLSIANSAYTHVVASTLVAHSCSPSESLIASQML